MASTLSSDAPVHMGAAVPLPLLRSNHFVHFTFHCGESAYSTTQSAFVPLRAGPAVFRYHTVSHTVPALPGLCHFFQLTKDKCRLAKDFSQLSAQQLSLGDFSTHCADV